SDHKVDVMVADLALQLGLLALGDQGAAVVGDADVAPCEAILRRPGDGLEGRQAEHSKHGQYESQQPSHVVSLLSSGNSTGVKLLCRRSDGLVKDHGSGTDPVTGTPNATAPGCSG